MAKVKCEICGREVGFAKVKTADNHYVCAHCAVEKGKPYNLPAQRLTLAQLQGVPEAPAPSPGEPRKKAASAAPAAENSTEKKKKGKPCCALCGKEMGLLERMKLADGSLICFTCYKNLGLPPNTLPHMISLPDAQQFIRRNRENTAAFNDFKATKTIGDYLQIDQVHKKWLIPVYTGNAPIAYDYADIVSFELIQNNSQNDASLGAAILQMDAAVNAQDAAQDTALMIGRNKGFCNNLQIGITIKSMLTPVVFIDFIHTQVDVNSMIFKERLTQAKECLGALKLISDEAKGSARVPKPAAPAASAADELMKFKQLLDMGALTQEEFDAKKKQLLGL